MDQRATALLGEWKVGKAAVPLTLQRVDRVPGLARPQEPKRPFPYREEEITYENKKAKVKFACTLTVPTGDGPFPAVVMITGSGPQNRDEEQLGHKPFLIIADYLTRRGIAVVRVDDRPVAGGKPGPVTRALHAAFRARAGLGADPMPWELPS